MTWISLLICGFSVFSLYKTAMKEVKARLVETVQSQARIIETIAEFDAVHSKSFEPGGSRGATLSRIYTAHNKYEQADLTMEFAIAERNGNWILYLFRHRHGGLEDYLTPIPFSSDDAVPMQQALLGKSGVTVAKDYSGKMVLAAYEPLKQLNLGIVAQIDLSEIRAPFIRMGLFSSLFAVLVIGIGATLFFWISNPLIETLNQQNTMLLQANQRLNREMEARVNYQTALEKAHGELEMRVSERTAELSIANEMLKVEMNERLEAEQELKRNESMLEKIFDGILDPLILLSQQKRIMMMNQAAIDYYQIKNFKDVVGKTCHVELMDNAEVCQDCNVMQAITVGQKITYERKGFMNPERTESVIVYPLFGDDGSVVSTIVRISDITEKKIIERKLIQKEKLSALGLMVSSIAHEINNPNNFISFNIPILREYLGAMLPIIAAHASGEPDFKLFDLSYGEFEKDISDLILNIENGSKRITTFISNLRGFVHAGGELSPVPVDLTNTIDSVLAICHGKINQSVKSFTKNIQDHLPELYAHPYAIEQILINFVTNACETMDKENSWVSLDVATEENCKQIVISVSDNGHGMDEKTLSKVFDPFYTTKSMDGGSGLGLFVSHRLAKLMGGEINVESRLCEGTKFSLVLPMGKPQQNHAFEMKARA